MSDNQGNHNDLFGSIERDLPDTILGLTDIDENTLSPSSDQKKKATKRLPKQEVMSAPVSHIAIWSNIALDVTAIDSVTLEHEIAVFAESGQRAPVVVRPAPGGGHEAIGRAYLVEVVRCYNEAHPEDIREVAIEVRDLDNNAAYRLVTQELEAGPAVSSLERGLFYRAAIREFGSEAAFARLCGVDKATVSRNLDVVRVLDYVGEKILIQRDIAQRDASWFMSIIGRGDGPAAPERRQMLLDAVEQLEFAPAGRVFRALRKALDGDKPRKGQQVIEYKGRSIGMIRRKHASAPITILLDQAGDIELDDLVEILRTELDRVRRAATI